MKLQRHFNKYGETDLQFSVLVGCEKEDLLKTEQYFLDSYKPYFNNSPTAGNTLGFKFSEESKKRLSEKLKGRKAWNIGFILSEETRKKISEAKKGICTNPMNDAMKLKISKKLKGLPQSEDTKRKMKEGWERRRLRLGKPKSKYLKLKYGT